MAEQSLFGATPEALQASRANALQAQALQYAKLDPFQRATASIYQGAGQLGGAIGGMLGGQDPEMMRIKQRQQILQGIDLTSADSVKQGIQAAMQNNDFALANELNTRYQTSIKASLESRKTQSEIDKNMREKAGVDPLQQLIRSGKYTPESVAAYEASGRISDLVAATPEKADQIKEVGVAVGTGKPVYTFQTASGVQQVVFETDPKTGKQIMAPYVGAVDRATAKTTVSVDAKGEAEFVKELGKLDAKTVNEAMVASRNARSTLGALEKLSTLNNEQLISGSFAAGRVGATNLLNTLGLTSQADAARLATSENYQKVAGDVILQTLGGKLGAGFSNEDRKFIEGLIPQLENSPTARKQLIAFMATKNRDIITEASRLETYARTNKGLGGFSPKIPFGEAPTGVSAMTTEQLRAEIDRLKKGNK